MSAASKCVSAAAALWFWQQPHEEHSSSFAGWRWTRYPPEHGSAPEDQSFKADHWQGRASPFCPHTCPPLASPPSPRVRTSPSCVRFRVRVSLTSDKSKRLGALRSPAHVSRRRLGSGASLDTNGLLEIRVSPYYFVRLWEIKIDCPISSADWAFFGANEPRGGGR